MAQKKELRKEQNFVPSRMTSFNAWKELGFHNILGVEDLMEPESYPIIGSVQQIHDLINSQFRSRALDVHPDKNASRAAAVQFERITKARGEPLMIKSVAFLTESWGESIGSTAKPSNLYPYGLQLCQRQMSTAARSRMTKGKTQPANMSATAPIRILHRRQNYWQKRRSTPIR